MNIRSVGTVVTAENMQMIKMHLGTFDADGKAMQFGIASNTAIQSIVEMVNREANMPNSEMAQITKENIEAWWGAGGKSFLALDPDSGHVVAHICVVKWPNCYEFRSVITDPSYRNLGINSKMTIAAIENIFGEHPETTILEVKVGKRGLALILNGLNFVEITQDEASALRLYRSQRPDVWHVYKLTNERFRASQLGRELR